MKRLALLVLAASLLGCSTSGTKIDPATVATFRPGVTTYPQVVAALGEPTMTNRMQDGSVIIAYGYAQFRTSPATFIPVVGLFAGGGSMHSESVSFTFEPNGVMRGSTAGTSQASSGMVPNNR
jgi:hypothetical protein